MLSISAKFKLMSLDNPQYYTTTVVTEDKTFAEQVGNVAIDAATSSFGNAFEKAISDLADDARTGGGIASKTLKFFTNVPGVSNLVAREIQVEFNPNTQRYTVGEFVVDVIGGGLALTATAAVATAVAGALGVGTAVVGFGVVVAGISSLVWSGIKEIDGVSASLDQAEFAINNFFGTTSTDFEVVVGGGDTETIIGGAVYKDGLDEADETEAIYNLLGYSYSTTFTDISPNNRIRVRDESSDGQVGETRNVYEIYDGQLVEIIADELNISEDELLLLRDPTQPEEDPNIYDGNIDLYFDGFGLPDAQTLVYADSESRFYVPLPVPNSDEVTVRGFYPGNIFYGTEDDDNIDILDIDGRNFANIDDDHLILGLDGNDTIVGSTANDYIFGGEKDDTINGNTGEDEVFIADEYENYEFTFTNEGNTIVWSPISGNSSSGTDTLTASEYIVFGGLDSTEQQEDSDIAEEEETTEEPTEEAVDIPETPVDEGQTEPDSPTENPIDENENSTEQPDSELPSDETPAEGENGSDNDSNSISVPEYIDSNLVYRFYNNDTGVHFYTGNEVERDAVLELSNFSFEGASYQSIDLLTGEPQPDPVYRFLNEDTGVHLYTTSEIDREVVQEMENFIFEGEAFYAYNIEIGSEIDNAIPIFRFFNNVTGAHFYTPSAAEREYVENSLPNFQSEGIAYYGLPIPE